MGNNEGTVLHQRVDLFYKPANIKYTLNSSVKKLVFALQPVEVSEVVIEILNTNFVMTINIIITLVINTSNDNVIND